MGERKSFDWRDWRVGRLPAMETHSRVKLQVLRDYIELYIYIRCRNNFGTDSFKITLVDGFAGGGVYEGEQLGSPFVIMDAVRAAEERLNAEGRTRKIKIDAHYYFVEQKADAFACLNDQLVRAGFRGEFEKSIFLRQGKFRSYVPEILVRTEERFPRGGSRIIFFLDQCGYSCVDPLVLRGISERLNNRAEFIVNFAVKWFNDFLHDSEEFRSVFKRMRLDSHVNFEDLLRIKKEQPVGFPYLLESKLGPAFQRASGSPFFSPFYVQPESNHRGYWLLHLAPHARARSAMADIHWKNANYSAHYGHNGLGMLAYRPELNPEVYLDGMSFGDVTRSRVKSTLVDELARKIRDDFSGGVSFRQLLDEVCNETMANISLLSEVVSELRLDAFEITGPGGGAKRGGEVTFDDVIRPARQFIFPGFR